MFRFEIGLRFKSSAFVTSTHREAISAPPLWTSRFPWESTNSQVHLRSPASYTSSALHVVRDFPAKSSSGPGGTNCSLRHSKRSEEHTSELQSRLHLVCRLLLE